jgi:simple sugar transport system ATP-binding protein
MTSVLTPGEADEMLGMLRRMVSDGDLTVLMITHKFREVMAFADEVTILRRGKLADGGRVKDLTANAMARTMIGAEEQDRATPSDSEGVQGPVAPRRSRRRQPQQRARSH